jgi:hypothetical protein
MRNWCSELGCLAVADYAVYRRARRRALWPLAWGGHRTFPGLCWGTAGRRAGGMEPKPKSAYGQGGRPWTALQATPACQRAAWLRLGEWL